MSAAELFELKGMTKKAELSKPRPFLLPFFGFRSGMKEESRNNRGFGQGFAS